MILSYYVSKFFVLIILQQLHDSIRIMNIIFHIFQRIYKGNSYKKVPFHIGNGYSAIHGQQTFIFLTGLLLLIQ